MGLDGCNRALLCASLRPEDAAVRSFIRWWWSSDEFYLENGLINFLLPVPFCRLNRLNDRPVILCLPSGESLSARTLGNSSRREPRDR